MIVKHPDVDKIAFTGSTEVGRRIRELTAGSGKSLTLELGGKSPFIVFDDADLDSAVEGVVDAIWFNQGQVCCAGSRLLVQEGIHDAFVAKVKARLETLRVGPPLDKAIDVGAIVSPIQLERIRKLVEQGVAEGAQVFQGSAPLPATGCYFPPTLMTNVEPASTVARVEIFGPVVVEMTFRTPEEAVALANNTEYGLAASVWSESINLALDIAPKLKCGVVWVNSTNLFDASAGFGGYKESGYGREGGREGVAAYTKPRWMKIGEAARREARRSKPEMGLELVGGGIDRTAKMYIGGKQARPDGGYSRGVASPAGKLVGEVGEGNRKDIRNAVEAARKIAPKWAATSEHNRAQILYYIAENLDARAAEFADRLRLLRGVKSAKTRLEVDAADPSAVPVGRLGRQIRGRGASPALPRPGAGHERAGRRHRHRLSGGAGPARLRLADGRGDRRRQRGGHAAVGGAGADRHRPLSGARYLGRAGRRGQHRHRRQARAGAGTGQARCGRCALVFRQSGGRRGAGEGLGRQPQADLVRDGEARLGRCGDRRRARAPARTPRQVKNIWIPYGE